MERSEADLLHLEDHLRQRVEVRDEVLQRVARSIRKGMSGLREPRCPIATFVFLGSSNGLKERLAHAIAAAMFGDAAAVIRFIDDPLAGTHCAENQVATAVHLRPSSVLVFADFENARQATRELFLQIRDEGRATDAAGNSVQLKGTILIAWSSVGGQHLAQHTAHVDGQNSERLPRGVVDELHKTFAPEFLRVADFIIVR